MMNFCRAPVAEQAPQQLEVSDSAVTVQAERSREKLLRRWDSDRDAARAAARSIADRRRSADLEGVVDLCGGEGCHFGSGDAEAELVGAVEAVLAQLAGLCLGQR